MQSCDDAEGARGAESSSSRTDQTSPQLNDRTWDASYGIIFGSPTPTQQGRPPQLRTFKRSPSSTYRFFSTSSTVSLPARPLRRSAPSRPNPRLENDDDPYANLAPKPLQIRPQVRIPNPGEAARTLKPSQVQRLEEVEALRLAEAQKLKKQQDQLRAEVQKTDDERHRRQLEAWKLEERRIDSMAEDNVKGMRQKIAASGDIINQTASLVRMTIFLRRVADAQEKTKKSAQLTSAYREEYNVIDTRLRMFQKFASWEQFVDDFDEVYENLKEQLFINISSNYNSMKEDVELLFAHFQGSSDQKEELRAKWMRVKLGFSSLEAATHAYRRFWRLRVYGQGLDLENVYPEAYKWRIWRVFRTDANYHYFSFFDKFRNAVVSEPYFQSGIIHPDIRQLLAQCTDARLNFDKEYNRFMDIVESQWIACQSPIFRRQMRALDPFATYLIKLYNTLRSLIDLKNYHFDMQLEKSRHEVFKLSRRRFQRASSDFSQDFEKLILFYLERLHLQSDDHEGNRDYNLSLCEDIHRTKQGHHQHARETDDIFKGLEKQLKQLPKSKAWIANPIVWEMLSWDIDVRNQQELQTASTPRLIRVLQGKEFLSSPALKKFLASPAVVSKPRLLRISSGLVDYARRAQAEGVKSIVENRELVLLRSFYSVFEALNEVADTLEEQTQLPWIPKEAKDMVGQMWQSYGGWRDKHLKLGRVLLDIWLSTQGLDSLSRHHDMETRNILLWKKSLKQSMGPPKSLSLNVEELSTLRESVEESIEGGGLLSVEDTVSEPSRHDAPVPITPPGSLSYQRDSEATAPYWDYTQYIGPKNERVRVHYCTSRGSTERVIQKYFMDEEVIGFDMEWKANSSSSDSVKDNVSLIQVASESRIGLFHIARYENNDVMEDLVAPALRTLMESSKVIKAGVNIKADCTRLRKHLGVESKGLFELSHLYKLVKYAQLDPTLIDRRPVKMSDQVEQHLGLPLWKGDVRTSNWAGKLGNEQILYAASDPYVCLHLFDVLECKREAMVPRPPRPEFAELNKPILLANGQSIGAFKRAINSREITEPEKVEEVGEMEETEMEEVEEIEQDSGLSGLDSGTIQRLESTIRAEDSTFSLGGRTSRIRQRRPIRVPKQLIISALSWEDIESKELSPRKEEACLFALKWAREELPRAKGYIKEEERVSWVQIGLVRYSLWHHKQLSVEEICSVLKTDKWEPSRGHPPSRCIASILDVVANLSLPADKVRLDELFREAKELRFGKKQTDDWKSLRAQTQTRAGLSKDAVSPNAEAAHPGTPDQSDTESEGISSEAVTADPASRIVRGADSIAWSPNTPRRDDSIPRLPNVPRTDDSTVLRQTKSIPRIRAQDGLRFVRAPPPLREPISKPKTRRNLSAKTPPVVTKTFRVLSEASDPEEIDKESKTRPQARKAVSEQRPSDQSTKESRFPNPGYPDLTAATTRPASPKRGRRSRSKTKEPADTKDPKLTPAMKTRSVTRRSASWGLESGKPSFLKGNDPGSEEHLIKPFLPSASIFNRPEPKPAPVSQTGQKP